MYITAAGTRMLVNSHKAVNDLLDRWGAHLQRSPSIYQCVCWCVSAWRIFTRVASQMTSGWRATHIRPCVLDNDMVKRGCLFFLENPALT